MARKVGSLRPGCSCSSDTLCPDRRTWAVTVHANSVGPASIRPTASSASPPVGVSVAPHRRRHCGVEPVGLGVASGVGCGGVRRWRRCPAAAAVAAAAAAAAAAATAAASTAVELAAGRGVGGGNGGGRLARCHQTADLLLCAAGLPISGKGRTYGTASSTVVRARALRGGGRRGGAPAGGAPEQELPASGSGGSSQQPARRRRRAPLHEQVARHHLSHLPTHEGARSAQCEADQRHGHGASSGSPQPYITGPPRHPTSRMLSPPTPGIGGEVARSESKQGGAEGLGRAVQQRAARSAEVRRCGTRRHLPLLPCPNVVAPPVLTTGG